MSKITKKQIDQLLSNAKNSGFSVYQIGCYEKGNEKHLFISFYGQGIDTNVYNKNYDYLYDFTDLYNDWISKQHNKKDIINIIYDYIN